MKALQLLLVEDNEGDILLTLDAFEEVEINLKIAVARNGGEALDFLFKRGKFEQVDRPDLILLDINLPIYSGHHVLNQIKRDQELKKIPVIMLTTSTSQQDIDIAYENYANSYVTKPIDMDDFSNLVFKIEEFWLKLSKLPNRK